MVASWKVAHGCAMAKISVICSMITKPAALQVLETKHVSEQAGLGVCHTSSVRMAQTLVLMVTLYLELQVLAKRRLQHLPPLQRLMTLAVVVGVMVLVTRRAEDAVFVKPAMLANTATCRHVMMKTASCLVPGMDYVMMRRKLAHATLGITGYRAHASLKESVWELVRESTALLMNANA